MFARGEFALGSAPALTLPQSAVQLREGFSYVFKVGPDDKVTQVKIEVGRRVGDRIEVTRRDRAPTRASSPPAAASSPTATRCASSRRRAAMSAGAAPAPRATPPKP